MADRTVSVKLVADVTPLVGDMAKAAAAAKALGSAAEDSSKRARTGFDAAGRSAAQLGDTATQSTQKVGVSAQEASRRISALRGELVQMSRSKVGVGVDVDTVAARADLARLRAQLEEIETSDPDVRVDAETAAAMAQIRALESQLNSIDGRSVRATVDVNDRGSLARATGGIGVLVATAAAASPVLGGMGAAAVAGLGAIGPMAASAAAGLGVLALGFSGVGDAVDLLEQRQEALATGTTEALAKVDAELADVGESTLAFARFWSDDVQPALERVRETAAAGLLPGVQEGIESLLAQEPQITRFVDTYARSLGDLTSDSLANLSNPQWERFWSMLETRGVPMLESVWRSGDNVAEAFASILTAFAPMATDMSAGIEDLTADFAQWSAELAGSQGFHEFTNYVRENWPKIREIIANVAETIGTLIEAGAPIAGAYLTGFQMLTEVLAGLPVGVVQALLLAFLGFSAARSVVGIVDAISLSFTGLNDRLTHTPGRMDATASSMGRMRAAAGDLVGGGVGGGVLGALAIGIGLITSEMSRAEQQGNTWAEAMRAGGAAATQASGEMQAAGGIIEQAFNTPLGRLTYLWNSAFNPNANLQVASAAEALSSAGEAAGSYWRSLSPLEQAQAKVAEWSATLNTRLQDEAATTAEVEAAKRRHAFWTGEVTRMQGELVTATGQSTEAMQATTTYTDYANEALQAWMGTLQQTGTAFIEPLGLYKGQLAEKAEAERLAAEQTAASTESSTDSWRDHVGNVSLSLNEYAGALEEQIRNQENWRANVVSVTERGGMEIGQILADMGVEGQQLTAQMANATEAEFQRMKDALIREAQLGGSGAAAALAREMQVMEEVGRRGAEGTAWEIANKLGLGTLEVQRIAERYGVNLATGINPVLNALGKASISIGNRAAQQAAGRGLFYEGGYTGDGGKYEPMGVVHGGEYVITKERTARLGVRNLENLERILPGYATGGFVTDADVPRPPSTAPYRLPISTAADATMQRAYDDATAWMRENAPGLAGGTFGASGRTPNGIGGLGPMAAAARQFVMETFGVRNIGGYSYRTIAGTNSLSDHALGKAIDVMIPNYKSAASIALGNRIASHFVTNPGQFGTKYVIWRDQINSGRGWGPYGHPGGGRSDTLQHRDHVHVSFYRDGTDAVPSDRLAYLHRGEAVVPAKYNPASSEFSGEALTMLFREFSGAGARGGSAAPQVVIHSPITFAGPVYGEQSMRQVAEQVVAGRDEQLARNVRSAWS